MEHWQHWPAFWIVPSNNTSARDAFLNESDYTIQLRAMDGLGVDSTFWINDDIIDRSNLCIDFNPEQALRYNNDKHASYKEMFSMTK